MSQEKPSTPETPPSNQPQPTSTPPASPPSDATATTAEAKPVDVAEALSPGADGTSVEIPAPAAPRAPVSPQRRKARNYKRVLRALREMFRDLEGDAAAIDLSKVMQLGEMEECDLLLQFNVTMTTADGRSVTIKGSQSLPDIFADHVLPRAVGSFETVVASSILDPVLSRFQTLLNSRVNNQDGRFPVGGGLSQLQANRPVVPSRVAPTRPATVSPKG